MNVESFLLWGFVATVVLTTIIAAGQELGLSRMSMTFMLGTMITPSRDLAQALGFVMHFVNGWIFALVYAAAMESIGMAAWWLGALFGLVHGSFVLTVAMPMLPGMHSRMAGETRGPTPTRQLQPPGFLALNYGAQTPLLSLVAHVAYGAIIGGFYTLAGG